MTIEAINQVPKVKQVAYMLIEKAVSSLEKTGMLFFEFFPTLPMQHIPGLNAMAVDVKHTSSVGHEKIVEQVVNTLSQSQFVDVSRIWAVRPKVESLTYNVFEYLGLVEAAVSQLKV